MNPLASAMLVVADSTSAYTLAAGLTIAAAAVIVIVMLVAPSSNKDRDR